MYRARLCGGDGESGPVAHVWWTITREVGRLTGAHEPWNDQVATQTLARRWNRRVETTREALELARQAALLTEDEDVAWFARCLEVGLRFAEVLAAAYGSPNDPREAREAMARLEQHLDREFNPVPTDVLGGDPGCWRETLASLRKAVGAPFAEAPAKP
jgi:hypothetical protein